MISACELCERIAIEKALKEEAERIARIEAEKKIIEQKIKTVEFFAEKIISPILEELTEIPKNYTLCYQHGASVYEKCGDWIPDKTYTGNPMKKRWLENIILSTKYLDYDMLNQYLKNFGFQINLIPVIMQFRDYPCGGTNLYLEVNKICLSMICPVEEN